MNIYELALEALIEVSVPEKIEKVKQLKILERQNKLTFEKTKKIQHIPEPGRPDLPKLVQPKDLPKRKFSSIEGQAAMIHSIVHIEFNAINLALDAVYRYQYMPAEFAFDWLQVAMEESYHYILLQNRLNQLGYQYGDFDAHNGLWEMAVKTADNLLMRMGLVPRLLEARGLDVTPQIVNKFKGIKDNATCNILAIIERDEIGHVALGTKWFNYECQTQNLDPEQTFKKLLLEHAKIYLKKPIATNNRRKAGFSSLDLQNIIELASH